jgi:5-carboxymethyl-2-hydroxymuconate isomerase
MNHASFNMPIIDFDYTDNLKIDENIKSFLLETHHILVKEIKTDLKTCRSTISKRTNYIINDGDPNNAFIILRIQMLPGRTNEIKNRLGEVLLEMIHRDFSDEIHKFDTQVRVYLTETDKKHYYGL